MLCARLEARIELRVGRHAAASSAATAAAGADGDRVNVPTAGGEHPQVEVGLESMKEQGQE